MVQQLRTRTRFRDLRLGWQITLILVGGVVGTILGTATGTGLAFLIDHIW